MHIPIVQIWIKTTVSLISFIVFYYLRATCIVSRWKKKIKKLYEQFECWLFWICMEWLRYFILSPRCAEVCVCVCVRCHLYLNFEYVIMNVHYCYYHFVASKQKQTFSTIINLSVYYSSSYSLGISVPSIYTEYIQLCILPFLPYMWSFFCLKFHKHNNAVHQREITIITIITSLEEQ